MASDCLHSLAVRCEIELKRTSVREGGTLSVGSTDGDAVLRFRLHLLCGLVLGLSMWNVRASDCPLIALWLPLSTLCGVVHVKRVEREMECRCGISWCSRT